MPESNYRECARDLVAALGLNHPPLAITFSDDCPDAVEAYGGTVPPPSADGRTGPVAAGCVFWMKAATRTFSTTAPDHANCSVGSVTHGLRTLEEVAGNSDVAAVVGAGWVSPEMFPQIPVVGRRHRYVIYGPLAESLVDPDVVFLRLNAKQAMVMSDAVPGLRFEGKPQCHIIAIAREQGEVAVSVGCMLSRVRTGMPNTEMTCAIPAARLADVVQRIKTTGAIDATVAGYASDDSKRFESASS
jgi:uncharacterized protein (DUF169 family)